MKDLKIKMSKSEVEGFANLTKMYIAGFQAANTHVGYLHSVLLLDYLESLKKKLPYLKPLKNLIKLPVKYMPLYLVSGTRFFKSLPPYELSIATEINGMIDRAVRDDRAAMQAYEERERSYLELLNN
jgi:hypothetical protein